MLTLVMALAVAKGIRQTLRRDSEEAAAKVGIKWPNDIVVDGKKVCGILTEMSMEQGYIQHIVIGVGINVRKQEFPEEIRDRAAAIDEQCGFRISRSQLIADIMEAFDNNIYAKSLRIKARNGKLLAEMGVVSGRMLKATGISAEVCYAEIMWGNVMKAVRKNTVLYHEISRYPAVSRDLALLVDKSVEFAAIEAIAAQTEKKLLKSVELFDVYEGKNLEAGKKSYAVSFLLQDENATLNDKQIDKVMQKLIANLQNRLGAVLR